MYCVVISEKSVNHDWSVLTRPEIAILAYE